MNSSSPKSNSTWLIVGASRGIGLELTAQLLKRGDRVFATARNTDGSELLKTVRKTANDRCHILECDVSSESSIQVIYDLLHDFKCVN